MSAEDTRVHLEQAQELASLLWRLNAVSDFYASDRYNSVGHPETVYAHVRTAMRIAVQAATGDAVITREVMDCWSDNPENLANVVARVVVDYVPRRGDGTPDEIEKATRVARAAARYYQADLRTFFLAGHEHEGLSDGCVSVAWEGSVDGWAVEWPETADAKAVAEELGVWFEPVNGCILAVIPR